MKENPADKIYDFMWDFVKTGKQKSNPQSLKEYVYDLIQLTTQKDAGQRGKSSHISYDNLEMLKWSIIIEATCLVLSGDVDKLIKEGDIK